MGENDISTHKGGVGANIAAAIVAAQPEIEAVALNKVNPHFRSRYADLLAVRKAIIPVYAKHGLTISQVCRHIDGQHYIETLLIHKSGETMSSLWPIVAERAGPQSFGSAATYARRYGLSAIAMVACEDDDDGNGAEKSASKASPAPPVKVNPPPATTEKAVAADPFSLDDI